MATDLPPATVHLIDYAYSDSGVFYHGTISDLDGTPKSTWTISENDHKTQVDQPIDQDTFTFLWKGVESYQVFKKSLVQGADTPMDFYHFQIIGFVSRENGRQKASMSSYRLSPTEADPDFKQCIKKLNVPLVKPKNETFFEKVLKPFRLSS
jgi:hypothetical protein